MNRSSWRSIATWIAGTGLIPLLFAGSAIAQNTSASYAFVVASGFLCDGAESGSCPAIAESPTGGSYEISGNLRFGKKEWQKQPGLSLISQRMAMCSKQASGSRSN